MTERWTQREDVGPRKQIGAGRFVYDSDRSVAVLLGAASVLGHAAETWEWDGASWVQVDDMGPQPGFMVFAPDRHTCIVLVPHSKGGCETWERSNMVWTQVADTGPARPAGLVYDLKRSRCISMSVQLSPPSTETWEWDGSAWTMVEDTGPPTREGFAWTYDSNNTVTILHGGDAGGVAGIPFQYFSDTWAWDGQRWKQVSDMGPTARNNEAMTYDDNKGRVLLFGGVNGVSPALVAHSDTWQWDGKLWRQLSDMGPPGRWAAEMCYDSHRQRAVLFGGGDASMQPFGDTWEFFDQP